MSWTISPFIATSPSAAKEEVKRQFAAMGAWAGPGNLRKEYDDACAHLCATIDLCAGPTGGYGISLDAAGSKTVDSMGSIRLEIRSVQLVNESQPQVSPST